MTFVYNGHETKYNDIDLIDDDDDDDDDHRGEKNGIMLDTKLAKVKDCVN